MEKVLLRLKQRIWNINTTIILVQAIVASLFVMLFSIFEDTSGAIMLHDYLIKLLKHWIIAIIIITLIKKVTFHLDRYCAWPDQFEYFSERSGMQFLSGLLFPSLLVLKLAKACYWLSGIDIADTRFYYTEFLACILLIFLFNYYYIFSLRSKHQHHKIAALTSSGTIIDHFNEIIEEPATDELEVKMNDKSAPEVLEEPKIDIDKKAETESIIEPEMETSQVAIPEATNTTFENLTIETNQEIEEEDEIDMNQDIKSMYGTEPIFLPQSTIAVFYIDGTRFAKTFDGKDHPIEEALKDVNKRLNETNFYQIREDIIVNREAIIDYKKNKTYDRYILTLKVKVFKNKIEQEIFVSQDLSPGFFNWYNKLD